MCEGGGSYCHPLLRPRSRFVTSLRRGMLGQREVSECVFVFEGGWGERARPAVGNRTYSEGSVATAGSGGGRLKRSSCSSVYDVNDLPVCI